MQLSLETVAIYCKFSLKLAAEMSLFDAFRITRRQAVLNVVEIYLFIVIYK